MIYLIIILFACAALIGLTMLIGFFKHKNASNTVIYSHGIFAATALALLVYYALQNPINYPKTAVILFLIAEAGGFYLFFNNLIKKTFPLWFAYVHALIAVSGFIALLIFVFI